MLCRWDLGCLCSCSTSPSPAEAVFLRSRSASAAASAPGSGMVQYFTVFTVGTVRGFVKMFWQTSLWKIFHSIV